MWAVAALRLLRVTAGAQRDQISSNPFLIPRRSGSGVPGNGNDETTSQRPIISPPLSLSSSLPRSTSLLFSSDSHQRKVYDTIKFIHPRSSIRSHRGLLARALDTA